MASDRTLPLRAAGIGLAVLAVVMAASGPRGRAEDLDEGKSPAQLFSSSCAACHKSPRGIVKSVSPSSLPGFLREHYTTGRAQAAALSAYVLGTGGTATVEERPAKGKKGAPSEAATEPSPRPVRAAAAPSGDAAKGRKDSKAGAAVRGADNAESRQAAAPVAAAPAPPPAPAVPPNSPVAARSPGAEGGSSEAPATAPKDAGGGTATPGQ